MCGQGYSSNPINSGRSMAPPAHPTLSRIIMNNTSLVAKTPPKHVLSLSKEAEKGAVRADIEQEKCRFKIKIALISQSWLSFGVVQLVQAK